MTATAQPNRYTVTASADRVRCRPDPGNTPPRRTRPRRPPADTATATPVTFTCTQCHRPIVGASGYLEVPVRLPVDRRTAWEALHRRCDPDRRSSTYWIPTSALTTIDDLHEWDVHLAGKAWIGATDWRSLVARHAKRAPKGTPTQPERQTPCPMTRKRPADA